MSLLLAAGWKPALPRKMRVPTPGKVAELSAELRWHALVGVWVMLQAYVFG
ncbi:MAG: hypothetical protein ACR2IE_20395 [Candidatus Sumerlaeaceae bacterium]